MSFTFFDAALMVTTLTCALVAGLVLGFSVVVMPGIGKLSDRDFLRAFKLMDGVIQDGQPVFMGVWVGSIISVIVLLVLGTLQLSGVELYLMWGASGLYLLTVQGPTIRFNIPLNNAVQALDLEHMNEKELAEARTWFEAPWSWWNRFRTWTATASAAALMVLQCLMR